MNGQNPQVDARVLLNCRVQKYFGSVPALTENVVQTNPTPNAQRWMLSFYLRGKLIATGDEATNHAATRASAAVRALEWMNNNGYP